MKVVEWHIRYGKVSNEHSRLLLHGDEVLLLII